MPTLLALFVVQAERLTKGRVGSMKSTSDGRLGDPLPIGDLARRQSQLVGHDDSAAEGLPQSKDGVHDLLAHGQLRDGRRFGPGDQAFSLLAAASAAPSIACDAAYRRGEPRTKGLGPLLLSLESAQERVLGDVLGLIRISREPKG